MGLPFCTMQVPHGIEAGVQRASTWEAAPWITRQSRLSVMG